MTRVSRYDSVRKQIVDLLQSPDPETIPILLNYIHGLTNQQLGVESHIQTDYDKFPPVGERRLEEVYLLADKIQAALLKEGAIRSPWQPITSRLSFILLDEHSQSAQPLAVTFVNDHDRSETIAVHVHYRRSDDGPWVGQLVDDPSSWILMTYGYRVRPEGGWAFCFTQEQKR
jgi:hypothetical protein